MRLLTEAAPALASTPADNEIGPQQNALELRQSMESLRAELLAGAPLSAARHAAEPTAADTRIIEQAIEAGCSPSRGIGGKKSARTELPDLCRTGAGPFSLFRAVAIHARDGRHSPARLCSFRRPVSHPYLAVSGNGLPARDQRGLCAAHRDAGSRALIQQEVLALIRDRLAALDQEIAELHLLRWLARSPFPIAVHPRIAYTLEGR